MCLDGESKNGPLSASPSFLGLYVTNAKANACIMQNWVNAQQAFAQASMQLIKRQESQSFSLGNRLGAILDPEFAVDIASVDLDCMQ